ncbi:MAG: aminoglycoside phosphotransferase family protein [Anaerolineae bacterium]|nr:aminoglycoside phosphotransferase family protein [Anaerolineae bacterium]
MPFISRHILEQIVERMQAGDTLIDAEPLIGGASAEVVLLNIQHVGGGTQKYLLRAHGDINRSRNADVARDEFKLLKILFAAGLPVAQPHYLDVSGELYPIPYLVLDYIEGATDFSPQNLADFIQQSAALLAQIHQVKPGQSLDFLADRIPHILWWIGYQPEHPNHELGEGQLREALRTLFPLKYMNAATLLHGDFWVGNFIWRGGKLVGVIDWEDAEVGDPLSDLSIARLDMLWAFGQDAMHDFTQAYQALMPDLDYSNLPQWDLFAALRPGGQVEEWAAPWAGYGRPDVTVTTMFEAHQWFVKQAFAHLNP